MPNALTGDFDVAAEFAVPAVNRLLAAMHSVERFPHSIAVRLDDLPPSDDHVRWPSLVAIVDSFGDPVPDQDRIGPFIPVTGGLVGASPAYSILDSVVNIDPGIALDPSIQPSNLQGRAQLQIAPPVISVADSSGTNVSVRMRMIARYFPDPGTPPLAEFVRGELTITAAVNQIASQVGNVIDVDIKADTAVINFVTQWSSSPLSAQDVAGVSLFIRNAIKTSFLPSNSTLPSNISHIQFKTLTGGSGAVAVMLNLAGSAGNPASVTNVFLAGTDDFGFGVGVDFVRAAFQPTLDRILSEPADPVKFNIESLVRTWHITYNITLDDAAVNLENGKIVLTIQGHANTATSWLPNFSFTVRQEFMLEVDGATANLVEGTVSLDTSSWIVNRFRGGAVASMKKVRDRALLQSNAKQTVRKMLSAEGNLGEFIESLLKPVRKNPVVEPRLFRLSYTDAEIRPTGIVLHGALSVTDWVAPHAEYETIPSNKPVGFAGGAGIGAFDGPDYSALKSWIPGGTIESYEWKRQGQTQPGSVDANRFVHLYQRPGAIADTAPANSVSGYAPLCVTVRGTRLSPSGPVIAQAVSATQCGYNSFPILDGSWAGTPPMIALAEPGPDGHVRVRGHAQARASGPKGRAPNLIVHFADANNSSSPGLFAQALHESGRNDAPAATILVLQPGQLATTRYAEGVTYSEDNDGAWARRFGVADHRQATTLIVDPAGNVMWKREGGIDSEMLAAALRGSLVRGAPVKTTVGASSVRIGHLPPNFLFEHAPGSELTLRKLSGTPVTLIFWRSSSQPSVDAMNDLEKEASRGERHVILAIKDGERAESAKQAASEKRGSVIDVRDPARQISLAYGVTVWPTIISIDSLGLVRRIRYGRGAGGDGTPERSSE